jgi:hypothetical protein
LTLRRGLSTLARTLTIPLGVAASLGLIDALRSLPGPGLALVLPLRETGHDDRASLAVVIVVFALVFGLAAHVLDPPHERLFRPALLRTVAVLACTLALQAVSLQLVRQASLGFDWIGALGSPAPYVCALGALFGIAAFSSEPSSDRGMRPGHEEHPVEGPPETASLMRIGT